ncbi:hypothetical protein O6H91_07G117500 [Diphasiastrum complanatum]|uniref:Uncharacterized protein n=3 Tax=Diphasiastrum complanatum TaxID=34168 RepID=A0ACC2D925_DIPCM|nr:hypothetical protein O6H91_07G117500 [Diphasiastrum complanatum]KAJ7550767.1 hypothetical protein O6H91_07G117500 [Diphasiastrum complanatum]KAJ7550768.1 hypothetical protein O6H91_07G117500 [Diphasiastrum complanatum]
MTTSNSSTVKNGTSKETGHLLWQRVQKASSDELYGGPGLKTPHSIELQDCDSVSTFEESVQVPPVNRNSFVMSPTSPQQTSGQVPHILPNPETQVPPHVPTTKLPKSDSRNHGFPKISVVEQGSYSMSRARPTAIGHGQDAKNLWTRKTIPMEDENSKCDVEDVVGSFKQQRHHRNSDSTRLQYELYHGHPEPIQQAMEPCRPRSVPSTANGSVNDFQEFRRDVASVQKLAQEQLFSTTKPSLSGPFAAEDLSGTSSMEHFIEGQSSHYSDRNSQKPREKDYSPHYAAQRWVPVDHRFGGLPMDSLKGNKFQDDDESYVSTLDDLKDIENVAVYGLNQRRSNLDGSDSGHDDPESVGMILSRSRQSLIIHHDSSSSSKESLKAAVLLLPTPQANDEMKSLVEIANFSTTNLSKPAESKNHPGNVSPAIEDFSSIAQAVLDAIHASLEGKRSSERLSVAVGRPIAEFEIFLEAVAPTIEPVSESKKVQAACNLGSGRTAAFSEQSHSDITDTLHKNLDSRCRVDDIPLSAIWDWYEEFGNYGVEVESMDLQRDNGCHGGQQFSAFFVPYLSGLQLFECTASCSQSPERGLKANALQKLEENVVDLMGRGSNESLSNIFDALLPKSSIVDEDYPSCCPYASEDVDKLTCRSCRLYNEHNYKANVHLLFEFYETEQPHRRRPLLQKVQELIKGKVGVQSQNRGNAALLGSLKLGDLHPASWFSVAWYSIYRIPEGLARDVFLTYHSFGHVVLQKHNACALRSADSPFQILMPVVGLQYYNCQVDHWLTLGADCQKITVQEKEGPAEILQGRLNTLKKAAAVMSGHLADTTKSTTRFYKHSDYQFFVNRGR